MKMLGELTFSDQETKETMEEFMTIFGRCSDGKGT